MLALPDGRLLPEGILTESDAHALARASEVARVFGGRPVPPPEALVAAIAQDARDLP